MRFRRFLVIVMAVSSIAAACVEPAEPTATFDGSRCTFAGPSDLDLNFSIPFVFVNESDAEASMAVWKVPDFTTLDDIAVVGTAEIDGDMRGMVDAPAGESATVSVLLDVPGDWLINCFTEDNYPAQIFQVFKDEPNE